ncbi:MAG TPA: ATP-binding protein [Labilithrix sp.]|nr:ATP-binding protein [Labilithrix sp.]
MPAVAMPFSEAEARPSASAAPASPVRTPQKGARDCASIILEPDGRIASWDLAAQRIFGLDVDDAIGESFTCLYPPDAVEHGDPARDLVTALDEGSTLSDETHRRRKEGTLFRASVHLAPIFNRDGSHLGFVQRVRNTEGNAPATARGYAEMLAKADLVLRSVYDSILVQDASGTVVYANDVSARTFGFAHGPALIGRQLEHLAAAFDLFDEQGKALDFSRLLSVRDEMLASGASLDAALYCTRDRATNESRWWLMRFKTLNDERGRLELLISVGTDVTETVRSKEAARYLSETTRLLAASLDYTTTLRTLVEALVPRVADWASVVFVEEGIPRQVAAAHDDVELVARSSDAWARLGRGSRVPDAVETVLRSGQPQLHANVGTEMLASFATNEAHLALLRRVRTRSLILAPIIVSGRTDGVLVLSTVESKRQYDRTDLELAAEIGRRAGTAIEHARLYRDAQQAVRLRDEFLSVAAHELRTPLAALTLQLQSLRTRIADVAVGRDGERFQGRIDKTLRQSSRLTRLVDGLLDVSQVAGGRLDLHRQKVDLRTVVSAVCNRFEEDAKRVGSEVSFSSSGPCVGEWDADRLDQVVSNLLSNALKYGQGSPVSIRCTAEEDTISVTVTDRGIGIAEHDLERIFGRFERAVSEHNYGGLGLGLWIAQEIAHAHGGRVDVESVAGQGATFRLVLPLTEQTASRPSS